MTWKCHICKQERPDSAISVRTTDLSAEKGFPPGTFKQNVRYCNDRPECVESSRTFSFFGGAK